MSKIAYLIAKEDWAALAELKAVDALIEALETLIENEQLWEADGSHIFSSLIYAADAKELETSTSKVMKFIHKCLTNDEDSVRVSASSALDNSSYKFPIEILMYTITDENSEVRMNAASAIGSHGEDAVGPLVEILEKGVVWHGFREKFNREYHKGEKDLSVWQDIRTNMIEALGYTKSKNAVDILVKIMNENQGFAVYDQNGKKIGFCESIWECEEAAAEALGKIGDKKAIEPLNKAIESGNLLDSAKMAAALSLGLMDEPNGIKIIITEYKSEKRSLTEGWNELKQLPPKKVGKVLEELELYEDAEEWYTSAGILDKAAEMRRKKADMSAAKVSQKVIHGDYVDDRDTIIKDSVLNRSKVGGGGTTKMQELKELKEMFDSGFISKEEMEKMKKEILK
jgi:HEAT repeat protein